MVVSSPQVAVSSRGPVVVSSVRLLVVVVLIAGTQAGVYLIDRGWTPAPARIPAFDPAEWPLTLGEFHGEYHPSHPGDQTGGADLCGNWIYYTPTRDQVSLLISIWKDYTVVLPHTPEYCYKASGWKESSHKDVEVPVEDGPPITARIVFFERETEHIAVMFWYQFGDRALVEHEQLRNMQREIRGKVSELPPAIKVMLHTSAFDPDTVEARLTSLARLVAAGTTKIH